MSIADQLAATPPQIRCFALVGQFLNQWAALEATINNAIQTAFQITSIQEVVITRNMQFRDKINVLRTVCDLCVPEPDCAHYKNRLVAISKYSAHRNMVAHDAFHVDDADGADGVMFVSAKAKGRFELPIVRWSIAEFQRRIAEIEAFDHEMERLTPHLGEFSRWRNAALISSAMTTRDRAAQENANLLFLLSGDSLSSDPPSDT
jgi:hypothetical protein